MIEPELETRFAILLQKQKELETTLASSILRDIARLITTNIRELEGALSKVNLMQSLKESELTSEEVATILGKDKQNSEKKMTNNEVLKMVGAEFGVSVNEIKAERRTAKVSLARQVAMYIFVKEYGMKLEKVAEILNKKDHTTVLHGRNKIEEKLKFDKEFRTKIERLTNQMFYFN